MIMSTSNIFYGACTLLTVAACGSMFLLIDSEKMTGKYLKYLDYQDDNNGEYDTIRVYNPYDKKLPYRVEAEQSYELLRAQLKSECAFVN